MWMGGWMDGWEHASTTWRVTKDARVSDQEPSRDGRKTKPDVDERQSREGRERRSDAGPGAGLGVEADASAGGHVTAATSPGPTYDR